MAFRTLEQGEGTFGPYTAFAVAAAPAEWDDFASGVGHMTEHHRLALAASFTVAALVTFVSLGVLAGLAAVPLPPPPSLPPPAAP